MIEIELNNIQKNYGLKNVLDGFNLEIHSGERIALIGQNGSGKSTILKIIAKIELADSGKINVRKGASIGLLNQIYEDEKEDILVKDFLNQSFEEIHIISQKMLELEGKMSEEKNSNILDKLIKEYGRLQDNYILEGGYEIQEKFSKICQKFHINGNMLNQNYNYLSGGEKTRINLAKLLLKSPEILLLDEPTNHLDIDSLEFLEEFFKEYRGTIIVVSHDRYFLDRVVNKTVLLENGKEKMYNGNYSYFLEEDERRTLAQFKVYKNQQRQIEKMKESIKTLRKFGELAKNEMFFKRAKSIEKRLEKMELIDRVCLNQKPISFDFKIENRSGNDVLKIDNVSKKFNNREIFKTINLSLNYGEKVALLGENGSGKTTLIKMILGKDIDFLGKIKMGTSVKIGYIPQNIIFEEGEQTILNYYTKSTNLSETEARTQLSKYGFRKDDVFKKIGKLSGGEKVKIMLIKLIQKDLNFLILDEPTNHIDIDTRELLEEALKEYKGTVLFVSHDRFFINKLATRVIKIENKKIQSYYGNYDNYKQIQSQLYISGGNDND